MTSGVENSTAYSCDPAANTGCTHRQNLLTSCEVSTSIRLLCEIADNWLNEGRYPTVRWQSV